MSKRFRYDINSQAARDAFTGLISANNGNLETAFEALKFALPDLAREVIQTEIPDIQEAHSGGISPEFAFQLGERFTRQDLELERLKLENEAAQARLGLQEVILTANARGLGNHLVQHADVLAGTRKALAPAETVAVILNSLKGLPNEQALRDAVLKNLPALPAPAPVQSIGEDLTEDDSDAPVVDVKAKRTGLFT